MEPRSALKAAAAGRLWAAPSVIYSVHERVHVLGAGQTRSEPHQHQ